MPPQWLAMYDDFITKNAGQVSQIESALRSLTYIIPGTLIPSVSFFFPPNKKTQEACVLTAARALPRCRNRLRIDTLARAAALAVPRRPALAGGVAAARGAGADGARPLHALLVAEEQGVPPHRHGAPDGDLHGAPVRDGGQEEGRRARPVEGRGAD